MSTTSQIKVIKKQIEKGKVKNVFAAFNKVESLKLKAKAESKKKSWNNFLAQ